LPNHSYAPNKFYIEPNTFGREKEKGAALGYGPRLSHGMVVDGLATTPGALKYHLPSTQSTMSKSFGISREQYDKALGNNN